MCDYDREDPLLLPAPKGGPPAGARRAVAPPLVGLGTPGGDGNYRVAGGASDYADSESAGTPIMTDNQCTACCARSALWSCKACDMKYCEGCWDTAHAQTAVAAAAQPPHAKSMYRYRTDGADGKLKLSCHNLGAEALLAVMTPPRGVGGDGTSGAALDETMNTSADESLKMFLGARGDSPVGSDETASASDTSSDIA